MTRSLLVWLFLPENSSSESESIPSNRSSSLMSDLVSCLISTGASSSSGALEGGGCCSTAAGGTTGGDSTSSTPAMRRSSSVRPPLPRLRVVSSIVGVSSVRAGGSCCSGVDSE